MTMTDDEFMERSRKALGPHLDVLNLRDGHNGDGLSIQTWEEACAESQAWANKARRMVEVRRDRHRAYVVIALLVIVTIVLLVIVEQA